MNPDRRAVRRAAGGGERRLWTILYNKNQTRHIKQKTKPPYQYQSANNPSEDDSTTQQLPGLLLQGSHPNSSNSYTMKPVTLDVLKAP